MIIFDCETTDLVKPEASALVRQPRIIEFAAIKVHPLTLQPQGSLESFLNPGIPISAEITKITGITDAAVSKSPKFISFFRQLCDFFLGEDILVAHNLPFDRSVLGYELARIDKQCQFPWPSIHICTVEASIGILGHRLNLGKLHELATGKQPSVKHRAMDDVQSLLTCVRWLRKKRLL